MKRCALKIPFLQLEIQDALGGTAGACVEATAYSDRQNLRQRD